MATTYRPNILGQAQPLAGQPQTLVILRPDQNGYCNISVTNISDTTEDYVRVVIKRGGDSDSLSDPTSTDDSHYIAYDTPSPPNKFFYLPNIGLEPQDQVIVYSQNGVVSFSCTGATFINY